VGAAGDQAEVGQDLLQLFGGLAVVTGELDADVTHLLDRLERADQILFAQLAHRIELHACLDLGLFADQRGGLRQRRRSKRQTGGAGLDETAARKLHHEIFPFFVVRVRSKPERRFRRSISKKLTRRNNGT